MSRDTNFLFKPAMVRGLQSDAKTMTRRLFSDKLCITENPDQYKLHGVWPGHSIDFNGGQKRKDDRSYALFEDLKPTITPWIEPIEVPYAEVGDRIYVRETHYRFGTWIYLTLNKKGVPGWAFVPHDDRIRFEDNAPLHTELGKMPKRTGDRKPAPAAWHRRPGLFHEKGHTRIILECTEKKVERLLDISEEDAKREGVEYLFPSDPSSGYVNYMWHGHAWVTPKMADNWPFQYSSYLSARESFFSLWASINGIESLNQNPWVVALGFKRLP